MPDAKSITHPTRIVVIENNSFQNLIKGIHCEAFTQGAIVRGNDFAHLWASAVDLDHGSRLNQILSNKIRWTGEAFVAPAAINLVTEKSVLSNLSLSVASMAFLPIKLYIEEQYHRLSICTTFLDMFLRRSSRAR